MSQFIEIVGEYTDGEKLDLLINIGHIASIRPDPVVPTDSIIETSSSTIRVCEPYEILKRRILQAPEVAINLKVKTEGSKP